MTLPSQPCLSWSRNHPKPDIAQGDHRLAGIAPNHYPQSSVTRVKGIHSGGIGFPVRHKIEIERTALVVPCAQLSTRYGVVMNEMANDLFDAAGALEASAAAVRVQRTEDQDQLDIVNKERTSVSPWKGQFSPQLIEYLLGRHVTNSDFVFDPFCGSGTVLFETARRGINAVALDINPAAVCLAKASLIFKYKLQDRYEVVELITDFSQKLLSLTKESDPIVRLDQAIPAYERLKEARDHADFLIPFLLLVFGHNKTAKSKSILMAGKNFKKTILTAPVFEGESSIDIGDSRFTNLDCNSVGYIITSPPYINVFNYHHNYRPTIYALGFKPLLAARAEIGSNRKFRQNRYMTVVQYCMDMAQFFCEAARVLKPKSKMTIILGRESNVRVCGHSS